MSAYVQLLDYGICEPRSESAEKTNNSPTSYFLQAEQLTFIEKADNLKIRRGLVFGILYHLESNHDAFFCRIVHPTLVNPATGRHCKETVEEKYISYSGQNFDYYRLEYVWEMIAGRWTFQVEQSGNVLLEKSFNLYH